jgi:hypothetical protein
MFREDAAAVEGCSELGFRESREGTSIDLNSQLFAQSKDLRSSALKRTGAMALA